MSTDVAGRTDFVKTKGFWVARSGLWLSLLAGAAAAFAFPPFGIWPGIFGFGLLLWTLDRAAPDRPLRSAFACGWCAGFAYLLVSTWWIGEAFLVDFAAHGWQAPFAVAIVPAGIGLIWGGAGLVYRAFAPRGVLRIVFFAAVFGLAEWLRGHMLTGFPWNLPGEVWRAGSAPSQGAALIGAYGLSVVVLAIGAAPGVLTGRRPGRGEVAAVAVAAVSLATLWIGGANRLHGASARPTALRIRVVQVNVDQAAKWSLDGFRSEFGRYVALTAAPPAPGAPPPTLVIWPEGALPASANDVLAPDTWTRTAIVNALAPGESLLMGAVRVAGPPAAPHYYNSALLLQRAADGLVLQAGYDKHHLVPFGEYVPFDTFAQAIGFKSLVHIGDGFTAGPRPRPIAIPGLPRFQVLICYESLFPSFVPGLADRPAFIANISNDAWFGKTSGPWQHLNLASYRAIEEGVPIVRATPTGVSAVIDAYGRPISLLPLGKAGVIDASLPAATTATPFAHWRDIPFWIAIVLGLALGAGRAGRLCGRAVPA